MKSVAGWTAVGFLLAAAVAASGSRDLRTVEVLDVDCASDLHRNRMTLFGNGTVRLRTWQEEVEEMRLRELNDDEFRGFMNRLREIDLSEAEEGRESASGEWIETCVLTLDLYEDPAEEDGDRGPTRFTFAGYDSVSLALSRVIGISDELRLLVEEQAIAADFPPRYVPSPGDILKRQDGVLFEVIAFTADERGVELWGVDQPLVVYVLREDLIGEFIALVEEP